MRKPNTNSRGGGWTQAQLLAVWNKGKVFPGHDSNVFRIDSYGSLMQYSQHGDTTAVGWEVDHIVPVAKGGSDDINNLQPLQWQNNRSKGDSLTLANLASYL